jgi:hypothetical protein
MVEIGKSDSISEICVPGTETAMLRSHAIFVFSIVSTFILGVTVPACAQRAGPAVPSYNPGVPSYNPGVPRQAPGMVFRDGPVPRQAPGMVYRDRPQHWHVPGIPPQVGPYGYGYGGPPIVVVPQTVIIPQQRRRTTMDNPFFGDLGDPFF